MNRLKFIAETEKMQFEENIKLKSNYFFGNVIFPNNKIIGFDFPDYLQTETFILQKLTINVYTNKSSWTDVLTLNNTYKNIQYFETYDITPLLNDIYRIKAGAYITSQLIEMKDNSTFLTDYVFADNTADNFIDNSGNNFSEPI